MPFNLLLLPLLAGFYFISRSYLFSYSTSVLTKEVMLFEASIAGFAFLVVSRSFCVILLQSDSGVAFASALHEVAPFPYIGTSIGALGVGIVLTWLLNRAVPEPLAARWCYHCGKYSQLEVMLCRSTIGRAPYCKHSSRFSIIWRETISKSLRPLINLGDLGHSLMDDQEPEPLMLTLSDNKVYVGFVHMAPPTHVSKFEHVLFLPVWSGYRDQTRQVTVTTTYPDGRANPRLAKLIPTKMITSACLFVEGVFKLPPSGVASQQPTTPEDDAA